MDKATTLKIWLTTPATGTWRWRWWSRDRQESTRPTIRVVGSLMYLIAIQVLNQTWGLWAVLQVGIYKNPTEIHPHVAGVIRYLKGTIECEIFYTMMGDDELVAYTNSDTPCGCKECWYTDQKHDSLSIIWCDISSAIKLSENSLAHGQCGAGTLWRTVHKKLITRRESEDRQKAVFYNYYCTKNHESTNTAIRKT